MLLGGIKCPRLFMYKVIYRLPSIPLLVPTFLCLYLTACQSGPTDLAQPPLSAELGGDTTTTVKDHNAFSMPANNMPMLERLNFSVGNSFFRNPWVIAPATTTARDGLGPLFNTNACQNCHIKDGRGIPRDEPGTTNNVSMLVRISMPEEYASSAKQLTQLGSVPVPHYGLQIQDFALSPVPAEAQVQVDYHYFPVELSDGEVVELRRPRLSLSHPGYGDFPDELQISARIAPPMIGLGLLQAIPEDALLQLEHDSRHRKHTTGKLNRVWDHTAQKTVIGRFGWKAGQPNLTQQNAMAFHEDLGITSTLFADPPCQPTQTVCLQAANGGEPELRVNIQDQVDFYTANLAVPAMRGVDHPEVRRGAEIFSSIGCDSCHKPHWKTGPSEMPWLAHQDIYPYTDLMLHDMGDGLADNRAEFEANGREWRTPPLWGIGLTETVVGHAFFLHDGRARSLREAILWHGGEAERSRETFMSINKTDRQALLTFLKSL